MAGIAHRPILGLELSNAFDDSLPEASRLVDYANDVAILFVGHTVEQALTNLAY